MDERRDSIVVIHLCYCISHSLSPPCSLPLFSFLFLGASTYPFDVIKSVVQTAPINAPKHTLTIKHIAKTNYAQHGISWFFKGITPTLIRAVPTSAVTFYVYEWVLDVLGR